MHSKLITTAINYTNGDPHIGHCYEAILADCLTRFYRLYGCDIFLQTGTDEHGQKIEEKAASLGKQPQELCDHYANIFKKLAKQVGMNYDNFIRTTDTEHKIRVQTMFSKLKDNGEIYLGTYEGWYNLREETFVSEHEAKLTNYTDQISGLPLRRIQEPSYFFSLSNYLQNVLDFLEARKDFIIPNVYQTEIMARLRKMIHDNADNADKLDLSISRTNIKWGIPVPTDPDHCLYVWMDALFNYHTGPESQLSKLDLSYSSKYPETIHVIGKDILWFHSVIWIALIMAVRHNTSINLPRQIYVHDFIVDKEGHKMSKSIGNTVDPFYLLNTYGTNAVRFYLLRETTLGSDLKFSEQALQQSIQSDLGAKLGNLVNRILSLVCKYCESKVPKDENIIKIFDAYSARSRILTFLQNYQISNIIEILQDLIHQTNQSLMQTEMWKLPNGAPETDKTRRILLRSYLEALVIILAFWEPIMPEVWTTCADALSIQQISPSTIIKTENLWFNLQDGAKLWPKLILFPLR